MQVPDAKWQTGGVDTQCAFSGASVLLVLHVQQWGAIPLLQCSFCRCRSTLVPAAATVTAMQLCKRWWCNGLVILLDVTVDQVSQIRLGRLLDVVYVCHVKLARSVQRLNRGGVISVLNQLTHDIRTSVHQSCGEKEASVVAVLSSRSLGAGKLVYRTCERQITKSCTQITITIYFINPSGKLKLSFDRTTKNISQIMNHTHMHTLIHTPPFSQSAYTNI